MAKYKIDSSQVQVIDSHSVYAQDNVEDVLYEIYKDESLKYKTIIEEIPQETNYSFIQDEDLMVHRESAFSNVTFSSSYIGVHAGASGSVPQKTVFTSNKLITYPFVRVDVTFRNSGDIVWINLKRVNDTYYSFKITQGTSVQPQLYYYNNGTPSSAMTNGTQTFTLGTKYQLTAFCLNTNYAIPDLGQTLYLYVNSTQIIAQPHSSITRTGKFEIVVQDILNSNYVDISYIKVGSFSFSSQASV